MTKPKDVFTSGTGANPTALKELTGAELSERLNTLGYCGRIDIATGRLCGYPEPCWRHKNADWEEHKLDLDRKKRENLKAELGPDKLV